jgi:hypothetical protein
MGPIIKVSKHLEIELIPSTDKSDPALRLFTPGDPSQSFIMFMSELHSLRDALVEAGAQLSTLEKQKRLGAKKGSFGAES